MNRNPTGAGVLRRGRACVRTTLHAAVLALAPAADALAAEAAYPAKTVRVVVPFSPGGGSDISTRLVAQKVAELWGQSVVVDNRAGAGGTIGSDAVAKAAPDGYTLLAVPISHAAVGAVRGKLPYDPERDFAPIIHLASAPNVVVVHPVVPARSMQELVALARSRSGEVSYASGGHGSSTHLAVELLRMLTGIELNHIPYKGGQATMTDLLAGQVFLFVGSMPATLPHVRSGRLRGLAVTSARRAAVIPELPTVDEAGVKGYEYVGWYGILAPAGTPESIVRKINADMQRVLAMSEVRDRFAALGAEVVGGTPADFARHLSSEIEKWIRVAEHAGIRPKR